MDENSNALKTLVKTLVQSKDYNLEQFIQNIGLSEQETDLLVRRRIDFSDPTCFSDERALADFNIIISPMPGKLIFDNEVKFLFTILDHIQGSDSLQDLFLTGLELPVRSAFVPYVTMGDRSDGVISNILPHLPGLKAHFIKKFTNINLLSAIDFPSIGDTYQPVGYLIEGYSQEKVFLHQSISKTSLDKLFNLPRGPRNRQSTILARDIPRISQRRSTAPPGYILRINWLPDRDISTIRRVLNRPLQDAISFLHNQ